MNFEICEKLFKKYYGIIALILWFFLVYQRINIQDKLFSISLVALSLPFALLAIYAITDIGKSVKGRYVDIRKLREKEIKAIRKEQEKIEDIKKLIKMDEKILYLRKDIYDFIDTRFIKYVLYSLFAIAITLALSFLDILNSRIDPPWTFMYITLNIGIYYIFRALFDILHALRRGI